MSAVPSPIRDKAIVLFNKIDRLAVNHIRHQSLKYLYEKFVRKHIEGLIRFQIPEAELKTAITEAYYEIEPIVKEFQISHSLQESKKLNSPEMTKLLMKLPDFKDMEDLLDGV